MLDALSMVPLTSMVHVKVIWQDHGHFGSKVQQNMFYIFIHCLIFNILISRVDLMAEYCVFKCVHGKCPMKQKLSRSQPAGARLRNIIDASIQYGDSLHVDLQEQLDANENLQMSYHRSCITWYLTHAPESETGERCSPVKRKRRSAIPLFKFREHCIYCGETCAIDKACKNPNRWVPAYLVTEVDTKELAERGKHVTSKDRIVKQCNIRAGDWADVVMMRVTGAPSDLNASDEKNIYTRNISSQLCVSRHCRGLLVSPQFVVGTSHLVVEHVFNNLLSINQYSKSDLKRSCMIAQHTGHYVSYEE